MQSKEGVICKNPKPAWNPISWMAADWKLYIGTPADWHRILCLFTVQSISSLQWDHSFDFLKLRIFVHDQTIIAVHCTRLSYSNTLNKRTMTSSFIRHTRIILFCISVSFLDYRWSTGTIVYLCVVYRAAAQNCIQFVMHLRIKVTYCLLGLALVRPVLWSCVCRPLWKIFWQMYVNVHEYDMRYCGRTVESCRKKNGIRVFTACASNSLDTRRLPCTS